MEITTQTVKDVTAMNIHAGVHKLAKALHAEVKHIGNHISERIGHLTDQQTHTSINEDETAEMDRLDHLLGSCVSVMDTIQALVNANDIGYGMVMVQPSDSPEELETVKAVVTESKEYKALLEVLERRKREAKRIQVDTLMELLGGNLWEDKDSLNGN